MATIVLPVLFGMAEYERKLLSYRMKLGFQRAREQGKVLGGYRGQGRVGVRLAHPQRANILKAVRAEGTIAGTAWVYGGSTMPIYRWITKMNNCLTMVDYWNSIEKKNP